MKFKMLVAFFALVLASAFTSAADKTFTQKLDEVERKLGKDKVIRPEAMAEKFGFTYTEDQLRQLEEDLPSGIRLRWLKHSKEYVLHPGPTVSLSEFHTGKYHNPEAKVKWGAIKNVASAIPLSPNERIPEAIELVWMMVGYFKTHFIKLFPDTFVRSSTITPMNGAVVVGLFTGDQPVIYNEAAAYAENRIVDLVPAGKR